MQAIFVSSMSERRCEGDDSALGIFSVEVEPWSLEQQLAACKHPTFLRSVIDKLSRTDEVASGAASAPLSATRDGALSIEELVEEKHYFFFFAGGNARWMFALTKKEMLTSIRIYVDSIMNKKSFFGRNVGREQPGSNQSFIGKVQG